MTPAELSSRDWWTAQVHPLFVPVLLISMWHFHRRLAHLIEAYGPRARVNWVIHWWGFIEIETVWLAEPEPPAWQTEAEAVVARLLSGIAAAFPEIGAAGFDLVASLAEPQACAPEPALCDSS